MSLASAVRTAARPTAKCAVGRDSVRLARPRAAAAPRRASRLALGSRKSGVTRLASQDPGASVDVDDVAETSAAAREEALECVVVGMEAACVLSEDEGDVVAAARQATADPEEVHLEALTTTTTTTTSRVYVCRLASSSVQAESFTLQTTFSTLSEKHSYVSYCSNKKF